MSLFASRKRPIWIWAGVTLLLSGYLTWVFFAKEDKRQLLPGITTDGHHQIEQRCDVCHDSEPAKGLFTSSGVSNKACLECHQQDLELANDSHPVIKFRNPENAIFLEHIAATQCVTCHTEHVEDRTHPMALTIPPDYCAHCHEVTLENRETHKGLAFNTCATAGCHNFHDNLALFESFLGEHLGEPIVLPEPKRPLSDAVYRWISEGNKRPPATVPDAPADRIASAPQHVADWAETAHAAAGVNCSDCHGNGSAWADRPAVEMCGTCHSVETKDFEKGMHGMRLAVDLSPMEPSMARLPMKPEVAHQALNCNSCHGAHRFDRQYAAAEACMKCHADDHSNNFAASAHYELWEKEVAGNAPAGTGVSCATCHLPREIRSDPSVGAKVEVVQHNQNANLRPNEKMYRGVCMNCHGLGFTMDSLADRELIESNFNGHPEVHVESLDWVQKEADRREAHRKKIKRSN